ncbi:hypothetical protein [Streptomyces antarcticus]|uniref:hypothetical protein n=1 Tax=Streptomyces antarcticus TaxID=2996458 RepID=UPI00226FB87F|nr:MULTISPECIES: hypothetical protein [unclassified Streptomyces]MCY0943520.1 hypothetical protein [Streptomyces sp. H34-AA3]MCZ4083571.1 hypothetical protein [Streptomyces sp. H34-S5]
MRICCRCDRAIRSEEYEVIPVDSASAARPDQHAHSEGDPNCRSITVLDPTDIH